MVNPEFLLYLVTISKVDSISIAAEQLHVSQPGISSAIQKLEKQLDLKLIERHYNGVTITEDGKKVVALAEQLLELSEQIEAIRKEKASLSETIDLSDITIYCNPAFTSLLVECFSNYNNPSSTFVQIIDTDNTLDPEDIMLKNPNSLFFGIVDTSTSLSPLLRSYTFNVGKTLLICSKDFPYFAPEQASVSFKDLINVPFVLNRNSLNFQNQLFKKLQVYGEPVIYAVAPNRSSCTLMIKKGFAAQFASSLFTPETRSLRVISIKNAPKFGSTLIYNENFDLKKLEQIVEIMKPVFAKRLQPSS